MKKKIRINRFLASAGIGSRRKCEKLVLEGCVELNGEAVTGLSTRVDPDADKVTVNGVEAKPTSGKIILALNKPAGVISSASDGFGRKTVLDIARERGYSQRLFPVGRLDIDTTGLILLTDDGEFAFRMTHPMFKVEKRYRVTVKGEISQEAIDRVAEGVDIGGYKTRPCKVELIKRSSERSILLIHISEGKKRQIKKMFSSCGHEVVGLERTAIGGVEFEDIKPGELRPLAENEEISLRRQIGLN